MLAAAAAVAACGDPADESSSAAVAEEVTACDAERVSHAAVALPIRARLHALAARFRRGLPEKEGIARFFDAGAFYHNGLGLDAWLDGVLLAPRSTPGGFDHVGFTVSDVKVDEVVDRNHVFVTYTVAVKHGEGASAVRFRPWTERMLMTRTGRGGWRIAGNQQVAAASVGFRARLAQKALTQAELDARPDVFTEVQTWDPQQRSAYFLRIPVCDHADPACDPASELHGWIGFPGEAGFGEIAWVGDAFDNPWTPDVNERELRRQYTRYLATPNARVVAYMVFEVSSLEIDPRVAWVRVTGPGLPAQGLNLVRSDAQFPRSFLIFRGDQFHWNAFSTARCASMAKAVDDPADPRDYIPGCALDWSAISDGSQYLYAFHDAAGNVIGERTLELKGEPLGDEAWYEARDRYFGQFALEPAHQFTVANVFDTSAGAPFAGGGTVQLAWTSPTDPGVQLEGVSYWREYFIDDAFWDPAARRQEEHWSQLWGSGATSAAVSSEPIPFLTSWSWSTLIYRDSHGNWFDHEVAIGNPH